MCCTWITKLKFAAFLLLFACPGLVATPTHVELRGSQLPMAQQGYMLPLQDTTASGLLHELCESGSELDEGVPLPYLTHSTIERYAPCLSVIAQGLGHNDLPFIIEQRLREYLCEQPDLYNAINFADRLSVPLLSKAALVEASVHISKDNVHQYESVHNPYDYKQLCLNYM